MKIINKIYESQGLTEIKYKDLKEDAKQWLRNNSCPSATVLYVPCNKYLIL